MIGTEAKKRIQKDIKNLKDSNLKSISWLIFKAVLFLVLPFFVMVRTSVFLHAQYSYHAWICLLGGVLASAGLLFIYITYGRIHLGASPQDLGRHARQNSSIALLVALLYCGQTVLFFSAANAKGVEVRSEFRSLHPALRLALSTLVFVDTGLLITDAQRSPEDYRAMGLPSKRYSLHFRQSDGYVHAVDLRTKERGFLRNGLVTLYFRLMGFRTLRHTGTDDHLHVSLKSHDRPGGI